VTGRFWPAAGAVLVVALAAMLVAAGGQGVAASGSTVSRGPGGWLAARRYLEARGARVTLVTEPLERFVQREESAPPGRRGVLVLVFPWQQGSPAGDLVELLDEHLQGGGDLVLAYSGGVASAERALGLLPWHEPGPAPLLPWRWWAYTARQWEARPAGSHGRGAGRPLRIWAPRALPDLGSQGAEVLYEGPGGRPVAAVLRRRQGRVVVLPADALSNARLAQAGNADLLETLLLNLGRRWAFDEAHHGLITAGPPNPELGRTADLLLVHMALLYLLALAALGRRQGPAWQETAAQGGSVASFLLGLGALHDRLGHHRAAAELLLRRVRETDRGLELPPELERQAANAGARDLVEIARRVAGLRAGRTWSPAVAESLESRR
jgi:hypothetical protein